MGPGDVVTVPADASTATAADAVVPGRHDCPLPSAVRRLPPVDMFRIMVYDIRPSRLPVSSHRRSLSSMEELTWTGAKSATRPPVTTDWKCGNGWLRVEVYVVLWQNG